MAALNVVNALMVALPWLIPETEETMALMGKDFWPYGIAENMREITALTQYAHEQGLIERKVAVEELFHPSMFEISKEGPSSVAVESSLAANSVCSLPRLRGRVRTPSNPPTPSPT